MRIRGTSLLAVLALGVCAGTAADDQATTPPGLQNLSATVLDLLVKDVDVVGLETLIYGDSAYMQAASQVFQHVLNPYFYAGTAQQAQILQRIQFSCAENLSDPSGRSPKLAFPVALLPGDALTWHRYSCSFTLTYPGLLLGIEHFQSPVYAVNQLDLPYGAARVEPAVAFQNYDLANSEEAPWYPWLGRYVQSLNQMLRSTSSLAPANAIAGVNGGFDYRVNAWENYVPEDNPCPPRYARLGDPQGFYQQHPPPAECGTDANGLPSCGTPEGGLPIIDDMGDSLVYLAPAERAKSWQATPFQSYNCGSIGEKQARGAVILYPDNADMRRTSPSKNDVAELALDGVPAVSAVGSGPLLVQDGHYMYDDLQSEEDRPIDDYEVGGQTGVGKQIGADGSVTLHIVNVDGEDYSEGFHDWLLGLYLLSPYVQSSAAVALGNGGDATLWINPQSAAVQAVLANTSNVNHGYFESVFVNNANPGIVSNCSGYTGPQTGCSARPLHDGLFVYTP
jgi:hypothetical protein